MSDVLKCYNHQKGNTHFQVQSTEFNTGSKMTMIPEPTHYNASSGGDCCPKTGSYQKNCPQLNPQDHYGPQGQPYCGVNNGTPYYNVSEQPQQCGPELLDVCNKPSYKTSAFEIKEGAIMKAGKGVNFREMECSDQMPLGGILVENAGVRKIGVYGSQGTGLDFVNKGTLSEPNFNLTLNRNDLRDYTGYVTEIVVNGRSYKPQQGILSIGGAGFGSPISILKSPNSTIGISPIAPGTAGLDVKPIKVNGQTLQPDNEGYPFDIVDGNSTTVTTDGNKVSINVDGAVTSVNGQTGAVSIPTLQPTQIYQGYLTLTSGNISDLTGSGLDLSSITVTGGNIASSFTNTTITLYKNGEYMTLADYTVSGSTITSTLSFTPSDKLSWIIFKN
jgi:hypothetical protein